MLDDNPFAAGSDPKDPSSGRTVALGEAISLGSSRLVGALLPTFGAGVALALTYLVSVCTCLGWVASAPFMIHGANRYMLSVVDGDPRLDELLTGFRSDPVTVWLRGWGVILVLMVVMLPSVGVVTAVQFAVQSGSLDGMLGTVINSIVGGAWAVVVAPIMYGSVVWADRDTGVGESYKLAFQEMRNSWGAVAGLALLMQVVNLPFLVASQWLQPRMEEATLANDGNMVAILMAAMFGMYVAMALVTALCASWSSAAYRQVFPALEPVPVTSTSD